MDTIRRRKLLINSFLVKLYTTSNLITIRRIIIVLPKVLKR